MTASNVGDALAAAADVLGGRARTDVALGPMTTYRVGGAAALFVEVADEADLALVTRAVRAADGALPILVVGLGSNLLVADSGFPGLAVALGAGFESVRIEGTVVHAGGATPLPVLARRTAAAGLRGLEWAVGVPGSVGGGVRMNAGGHGSDMASRLRWVRVHDLVTGNDGRMDVAVLGLGYRRSRLSATDLVVEAAFTLEAGDPATALAEIDAVVSWRRSNQPGGRNAGSVFVNPPGDSAGRLIEAAGAKGLRLRTAQVSDKHANFIQADVGGSADDVWALMAEVRRRVVLDSGVQLETEVRTVGFADRQASR